MPDPGTGNPDGFVQLAGVVALGTLAGIIASSAIMNLVERVPPLWPAGDVLVFALPPVVAAAVVVAAIVVPPVAALAVPLGVAGLLVAMVVPFAVVGLAWIGRRIRG